MKIRKFLSTLLACMLLSSLLPSAEAIDCAIYDAYAAPANLTVHPAPDAGPRSFTTARTDEAAGDGGAFHPYVFTVDENASVSARVQLQPALMVLTKRGEMLTEASPDALEGDGSVGNPYRIGTDAQLEKFRDIVNGLNGEEKNKSANAVLTADIDLAGESWMPISDFAGSFDGAGHVLSGLNVSGGQYAGLFGTINEGSVHQLGVQGSVSAEGAQNNGAYAGGIVGYSPSGNIDKCWFNGTVSASCSENGSAYVGGIVGIISSGGRKSTDSFLEKYELKSFFSFVVSAEDCRFIKPHPMPLLLIARKADVSFWHCLMVGDTVFDIICAKRAGARSAAVKTGFDTVSFLRLHKADMLLDSIGDLPDLLLEKTENEIGNSIDKPKDLV